MAQERRQTRDRRAVESDAMLVHRQHRKEMNDTYKNSHKHPKMPILSILLMVLVIITVGYVLKPENQNLQSGCALPPTRGVNWSNCTFIKLNVENQNMEFAILTDAILNGSNLLGANFSGSNMAYAEITDSDLSYTNLERVRLIGANMSNTKFDNAIWIDGQVCNKNSIGSCLTGRLDQE